jgi:oligopeptide transport system permease protein
VIESVFAIPGIGRYYVSAVAARDHPLVLGTTVLLATLIVLVNLAVDILYGVLDPRIRDVR